MTTVTSSFRRNHLSSAAVLSATLFLGLGLSASSATAQSVATVPVGAVTVQIAAGTGTTKTTSVVSFPLLVDAGVGSQVQGQLTGHITSVTANSLSNSSAAWTAGQLSTPTSPCLIQITSGAAAGRIFLISTSVANTATSLTIDAEEASLVDLTGLGIVSGLSGDTYRILECDTISSIFDTPATTGVVGGISSDNADNLRLFVNGAWRDYYYNTTSNSWLRIGPNIVSGNVPIRPDAPVIYGRLGSTPLVLTLTGAVPSLDRKAIVRNSGVTTLANGWPVETTLGASKINLIPGWVSASNSGNADTVRMFIQGSWRDYYFNGTNWLRVGPSVISDNVVISVGTGVFLSKQGTASGATAYSAEKPYTL